MQTLEERFKKKNFFFSSKAHTYIVLELLKGGELLERIREKDMFTEKEAVQIFCQLVSAVNFMHAHGIVHRDLKPEVSFILPYFKFL